MTDPMLRKLARQLVTVDKRVRDLETVPQLAHSSIDDGALPVYDKDGNLVTKVGKQDDGTWGAPPLQGPTPPAPLGVTATGGPGAINVAWTGEFVRDAAPLDFDTLEVLVDGVLAGAIPNRDGGTVSVAASPGTRYVSARIRTLVPRHSATTSPFSVEVGPPADQLFAEARERIEEAEGQIQAGQDALDAERLAREAALADAAQNLQALADELAGMPDSEDLAAIRQDVADAQAAVATAQADATAAGAAAAAAQSTADDAEASALAAAGIAADKGRIFYQPTAPTGEDESPNNLWIDSDDGRVYVWNGSAWEESQSEDLRDAATAAVAAQQAAEAADQKAQDAAAAAAAADQKAQDAADAAVAAQQTADDATIDARNAHNAAVEAQRGVDAAIERGDSILVNGSFEQGDLGWPTDGDHGGRSRIIEDPGARTGSHVLELAPATQNTYPESDFVAVEPGQVLRVRGWVKHLGGDGTRVGLLVRHHDAAKNYLRVLYAAVDAGVQDWTVGEWTLLEGEITVPEDVRWFRFACHATGPSTSTYHADDLQVVDVTEARAAQERAEEAYEEAASKPGMDEVNQAIVASANGKNAITVSADAPTASTPGAAVGDTWWRVDDAGDIFGQWSWTGSEWSARAVLSDVIANLDVGKLTVTGTSRFTTAVVDQLFADVFAAHKITANELVIAALDEDGEIKPDSVEAVMIKDGAITTPKLTVTEDMSAAIVNAMSVNTKQLVVTEEAILNHATLIGNTVVEGLQAHSISADKISGGDFSGETFSGGTFIGGVFATSSHPSQTGGVHIDPVNGIRGWDTSGSQRFQLDPNTGSLHLTANSHFIDPSSGDGLIVVPQTSYGNAALFFGRNRSIDSSQAAIWRGAYTTARDQLMLRGGNGGGITVPGSSASSLIAGAFSAGGNVDLGSKSNPTTIYGGLTVKGTVSGFDNHLAVERNFRASGSIITFDNLPTTSSAGNIRSQAGTGRLYVNTSSRRYKRNIVDWSPDAERVLALRPRQWQHDDPRNDEIDERWHVGFVAEEVDDLGLKGLVVYAGDGRGGWRPESLNYDRFAAAQQVVLRKHDAEIRDLLDRIERLEGAER